jgi:hypothetical protein
MLEQLTNDEYEQLLHNMALSGLFDDHPKLVRELHNSTDVAPERRVNHINAVCERIGVPERLVGEFTGLLESIAAVTISDGR